jgi:UDP-N-acetyl-D-galactosamine dehydrogenase
MSGYIPTVMRAARDLNDEMDNWVLLTFLKFAKKKNIDLESTTITILGYTFKENCGDTRNTKVHDLVLSLKNLNLNINIWDPFISPDTQDKLEAIGVEAHIKQPRNIELGFVCVYHDQILEFLKSFDGVIYDYKKPLIT